MSKENVSAFLKKYTMVIVLVVVTLFSHGKQVEECFSHRM